MKTRKRGEPFYPDYSIQSLTVLKVKSEACRVCDWVYRVRNSVCGHEQDMTHKAILQRRAQPHSGLCTHCGRIQQGKPALRRREENRTAREANDDALKAKGGTQWAHSLWAVPGGVV